MWNAIEQLLNIVYVIKFKHVIHHNLFHYTVQVYCIVQM